MREITIHLTNGFNREDLMAYLEGIIDGDINSIYTPHFDIVEDVDESDDYDCRYTFDEIQQFVRGTD